MREVPVSGGEQNHGDDSASANSRNDVAELPGRIRPVPRVDTAFLASVTSAVEWSVTNWSGQPWSRFGRVTRGPGGRMIRVPPTLDRHIPRMHLVGGSDAHRLLELRSPRRRAGSSDRRTLRAALLRVTYTY